MFGSVVGSMAATPFKDDPVETMEFHLLRPYGYILNGMRMSRAPWIGECGAATMAVAAWLRSSGPHNELSCRRMLSRTMDSYAMRPVLPDFGKISCGTSEKPSFYHAFIAARVEPVAEFAGSAEEASDLAGISAAASGGSEEVQKASRTLATMLWMARHGATKQEMRRKAKELKYDVRRGEDILRERLMGYLKERPIINGEPMGYFYSRTGYLRNTCAKANLEGALHAFFDTAGFESCIRKAITLGGAREALTAMAGALAAAFYGGVPESVQEGCRPFLEHGEAEDMESFSTFCQRRLSDGEGGRPLLHPDAFEVIRCRGRSSVYIVDPSRKELIARLKRQFGDDVTIAEPQKKDEELARMKGEKPLGTCISAPEPEVEVLYFQDGEFHTPADFYSDDAAPMRERHRAQSLFWGISYDVKNIRRELQEYCGYRGNGCIHFSSAIYPVVGENYIKVREGSKVLGSLCIDQSTGLLRASEGAFPDGTQTGDIPAADIVRDLCLSSPNKEKALRDALSSKDPELTGSLQL